MTEEQAKTKWCPYGQIIHQIYAGEGRHEFIACMVSACMMWRWSPTPSDMEQEGYCGLAGKEDL